MKKTALAIFSAFFSAGILRAALGLGIVDGGEKRGATLSELTETRSNKIAALDALLEKDELSAEERKQHDDLDKEIDQLDQRIKLLQKAEARKAEQEELEKRERRIVTPRILADPARSGHSRSEQRDLSRFSVGRAIRGLAEMALGDRSTLDGIEAEMAQEGASEARSAGISVDNGAVMISGKAVTSEQRDMTATLGTNLNQGGMVVQTNVGTLLDALFNALQIRRLGATVYSGLVGNLDIPRLVAGANVSGKAETGTASEVSPTTSELSLSPKRLPTYVDVSDQLLIQGQDANLEMMLRTHLINYLSAIMESNFVNGSGTNAATGILNTTGIGAVVGGAQGAAPDWTDIVKLVEEVDIDNALMGSLAYLTNPKVVSKLKRTPLATDGSGNAVDSAYILPQNSGGLLNEYRLASTNAVPSNLTKGSTTGCSAIIFGNFADYVIAQWSGIQLKVDPYTQANTGKTRIHAAVFYDGGVQRPVSFAAMKDATTT